MKRLIKRTAVLTAPPAIGETSKLSDDSKYQGFKSTDVAKTSVRTGPMLIVRGEVYYGNPNSLHANIINNLIYKDPNMVDIPDNEIMYGYYLDDYLGQKSVFFYLGTDENAAKEAVLSDDPSAAVYILTNMDELERIAKNISNGFKNSSNTYS